MAGRSHSPEPWRQDHKDRKTILDAQSRLVAVTTMTEDAERLVAGVNATRGLESAGLGAAPLRAAMQVLYEICRYHDDVKFRNHVDRRGGLEELITRANAAWRSYGEESFQTTGLSAEVPPEKKDEPAEPEAAPPPDPPSPIRARRRS